MCLHLLRHPYLMISFSGEGTTVVSNRLRSHFYCNLLYGYSNVVSGKFSDGIAADFNSHCIV